MNIIGDVLEEIKKLEDNSQDIIFSDPPYNLGSTLEINKENKPSYKGESVDFMDKWNGLDSHYLEEMFVEFKRVLKYGGFVVFAGQMRQALPFQYYAVKAELEMMESVYSYAISGFPKSLNISKALEKQEGIITAQQGFNTAGDDNRRAELKQNLTQRSDYGYVYQPKLPLAKKYHGIHSSKTPLKQTTEIWSIFRKPFKEGTIIKDILAYEDGDTSIHSSGFNIEESRVPMSSNDYASYKTKRESFNGTIGKVYTKERDLNTSPLSNEVASARYPAQLFLDGKINYTKDSLIELLNTDKGNDLFNFVGIDIECLKYMNEEKAIEYISSYLDKFDVSRLLDEQSGTQISRKVMGEDTIWLNNVKRVVENLKLHHQKLVKVMDAFVQEDALLSQGKNLKGKSTLGEPLIIREVGGFGSGEQKKGGERSFQWMKQDGYGNKKMEIFQKDIKSIISILKKQTTELKTLSASKQVSTGSFMQKLNMMPTIQLLRVLYTKDVQSVDTFLNWISSINQAQEKLNLIVKTAQKMLETNGRKTTEREKMNYREGTTNENVSRILHNSGFELEELHQHIYYIKPSKFERESLIMNDKLKEKDRFGQGNYSQSPICSICKKTINGTNNHSKCEKQDGYKIEYKMSESNTTQINTHPTLKSLKLIYKIAMLFKSVDIEKQKILIPFSGVSSEEIAWLSLGYLEENITAIEISEKFVDIGKARKEFWKKHNYFFKEDKKTFEKKKAELVTKDKKQAIKKRSLFKEIKNERSNV